MATGYEQVRSIVAHLAGDRAAADDVRLILPETGVCSSDLVPAETEASACCGGPAPASEACCLEDAEAKSQGAAGCGCADTPAPEPVARKAGCCGVKADATETA